MARNSADAGTAATNFADLMNYLGSPMAIRSFALQSRMMPPQLRALMGKYHIQGIDIPKLMADARQKGIDPLQAILGTLHSRLNGLPPDVMREVLGAFFHNQQARDAMLALLQNYDDFQGMRSQLGGADAGMLNRDFNTANGSPAATMRRMDEEMRQLTETLGEGFLPIMRVVNVALSGFMGLLNGMDSVMPGSKEVALVAPAACCCWVLRWRSSAPRCPPSSPASACWKPS